LPFHPRAGIASKTDMASGTDSQSQSKDATVRLRVRYPVDRFESGIKDVPVITDAVEGVEVPAKLEERLKKLAADHDTKLEKVG
jgi:hypothetical protein